uniref:Uncharacterized protein n=1 Tax=Leersia perrieri TaxID=77586 RepID=A0A0D9WS87_9ORYZ
MGNAQTLDRSSARVASHSHAFSLPLPTEQFDIHIYKDQGSRAVAEGVELLFPPKGADKILEFST